MTRRVRAVAVILGAMFSSSMSAQAAATITTTPAVSVGGADQPSYRAMSRSSGLSVGFSGTGTSVTTTNEDDKRTQYGYGYQVEGSFGFSRGFALGLEYAYSNINNSEHGFEHDPYTLSHVGLIGRYFFRHDSKRGRPYAEVALLQRKITLDSTDAPDQTDVTSTSLGAGLGFGVAIFATPRLAFDFSGQAGFGTFSEWKAGDNDIEGVGDVKASSLILRLGARFYIR